MKKDFSAVSHDGNSSISLKDFLTAKFIFIVLFLLWLAVPPQASFSLLMSLGAASCVALVSIFCIFINSIIYFFAKGEKKKKSLVKILKFLIFILLSIPCCFFLRSIDSQAKEKLWSEAVKIQAQCLSMKKCPEYPAGWKKEEAYGRNYAFYEYKTDTNTLFYFRYRPQSDHFGIYFAYGPDIKYCLNGGIDMQIAKKSCL